MICRGESEFMKNYSTSMGLKTLQAFSSNVLMALLQSFIVFTTWESLGKLKSKSYQKDVNTYQSYWNDHNTILIKYIFIFCRRT